MKSWHLEKRFKQWKTLCSSCPMLWAHRYMKQSKRPMSIFKRGRRGCSSEERRKWLLKTTYPEATQRILLACQRQSKHQCKEIHQNLQFIHQWCRRMPLGLWSISTDPNLLCMDQLMFPLSPRSLPFRLKASKEWVIDAHQCLWSKDLPLISTRKLTWEICNFWWIWNLTKRILSRWWGASISSTARSLTLSLFLWSVLRLW